MKKAIVSGATGFVGSRLVRMLLQEGIEVLALGRKKWDEIDPRRLTNSEKLNYIQIEMSNIESLSNRMKETEWSAGDNCVFFNFAWGGAIQAF